MAKFKKKPIVIEATQWFKHGDHPAVKVVAPLKIEDKTLMGMLDTLEGPHFVTPGDWIICGVKGELYPCKPDIFELTYDPVTEAVPVLYRLYYGQSEDGRGYPQKIGSTTSREEAKEHLLKIKNNPYAFGHIMIDTSPTEEIHISWLEQLP